MAFGKIYVFGDNETGKTELVKRLRTALPFSTKYKTIFVNFSKITKEETTLEIWDISPKFMNVCIDLSKETDLALYCIDLSKPLDSKKIEDDIKIFRATGGNSETPIILVGTKSDLEAKISKEDFGNLLTNHKFIEGIKVSSKLMLNMEILLTELFRIINDNFSSLRKLTQSRTEVEFKPNQKDVVLNEQSIVGQSEEKEAPAQKIIKIVDSLYSNIKNKENSRVSCFTANEQIKLNRLEFIGTWLKRGALSWHEELAVLALIRDVSAVKRNRLGFFNPHSFGEFEEMTKQLKVPDHVSVTETQLTSLTDANAVTKLVESLMLQMQKSNINICKKIIISEEDILNSVSINPFSPNL